MAIHIYTLDYIRMEITVLYLKISWHLLNNLPLNLTASMTVRVRVLNTTFNNISVILWWSGNQSVKILRFKIN